MARTGQTQKQRKAALNKMHLESLVWEFADAMRTAYPPYIANSGEMTARMKDIWARYRLWCSCQ
jgi:hypothetical protein